MSKIYLLRHGETEWNKEKRTQGRNDIDLSCEGIGQAEKLAKRLKNERIDLFFSSSLKRAYDTANIIAREHEKEVTPINELMEINFGCFEGLKYSEIEEKYSEIFRVWYETPHLVKIPDGETILELKERTFNKFIELVNDNKGKNILIVSHGITIKVIIASLMGIDLSNIHKIRQDNTGLNIFEYREDGYHLNLLNDTCHMDLKEDL